MSVPQHNNKQATPQGAHGGSPVAGLGSPPSPSSALVPKPPASSPPPGAKAREFVSTSGTEDAALNATNNGAAQSAAPTGGTGAAGTPSDNDLEPNAPRGIKYLQVEGPIEEELTVVRYDVPYAPLDPKKTMKLRQRLGLPPETRTVDANVRAVIDSFISPRTWVDAGVQWVQHASPYPTARIDVVDTYRKLARCMKEQGGHDTGICPIRTFLYGECFVEVIRQVVAERWERGLLLLKVHAERIMSQKAHRELYESRVGYACRLALKGEKVTQAMVDRIAMLQKRKVELAQEEEDIKLKCDRFAITSEEQLKIDEKRYADEIKALTKEMSKKKEELEEKTRPLPKK